MEDSTKESNPSLYCINLSLFLWANQDTRFGNSWMFKFKHALWHGREGKSELTLPWANCWVGELGMATYTNQPLVCILNALWLTLAIGALALRAVGCVGLTGSSTQTFKFQLGGPATAALRSEPTVRCTLFSYWCWIYTRSASATFWELNILQEPLSML